MFCRQCGFEIGEKDKFCASCGQSVFYENVRKRVDNKSGNDTNDNDNIEKKIDLDNLDINDRLDKKSARTLLQEELSKIQKSKEALEQSSKGDSLGLSFDDKEAINSKKSDAKDKLSNIFKDSENIKYLSNKKESESRETRSSTYDMYLRESKSEDMNTKGKKRNKNKNKNREMYKKVADNDNLKINNNDMYLRGKSGDLKEEDRTIDMYLGGKSQDSKKEDKSVDMYLGGKSEDANGLSSRDISDMYLGGKSGDKGSIDTGNMYLGGKSEDKSRNTSSIDTSDMYLGGKNKDAYDAVDANTSYSTRDSSYSYGKDSETNNNTYTRSNLYGQNSEINNNPYSTDTTYENGFSSNYQNGGDVVDNILSNNYGDNGVNTDKYLKTNEDGNKEDSADKYLKMNAEGKKVADMQQMNPMNGMGPMNPMNGMNPNMSYRQTLYTDLDDDFYNPYDEQRVPMSTGRKVFLTFFIIIVFVAICYYFYYIGE